MGVQLAAARLPVRAPSLVAQHADALVLLLLGVPTAAIDWQIAVTWALPAWVAPAGVCLVAALIVTMLIRPGAKSFAIAAVVAVLYALPVVGAIVRWHLVASPRALIGDGAYQTQLAGDFVLHGIDPYGADYGRVLVGMEVPAAEMPEFKRFLGTLGYPCIDESGNPAYRLFLG